MDNKKQYQQRARDLINPNQPAINAEMGRQASYQQQAADRYAASQGSPATNQSQYNWMNQVKQGSSPKPTKMVSAPAKPQATAYQRPDLSASRSRAEQLLKSGFVDAGGNGTSNMIFINPTTGETARNQLARERGVSQANSLVNRIVNPSNPQRSTQAGYYTPGVRDAASADFFNRSANTMQAQRAASDQAAARGMTSALGRDEYMRFFTPEGDTEKRKTRAFQELMMNPRFNEQVMAKRADRTAMLQDRERFKNARRDILRFMNTGYVPAGEQGQNLVAGQAARQNPFEVMQAQMQAGLRQQELAMQQNAMALEANLKQRGLDAQTARAVAQQKLAEDSLALRQKESEAGIESQKLRDKLAIEELGANIDEKAFEAEQAAYERSPEGRAAAVTEDLINQGVPPQIASSMAQNPMPPDAQLSDPEGIESEYDTFMASGMQPTPENFNRFLESRGKYYNPQQVTETMKKKIAEETVKRAMIGSGPMGGAFPQFGPLNEMIYGKSAQRELDKNTARRDAIIKAMTGRQSLPAPATAAPQTQSQPTQNPSRARAEALRKRSELLRGLAQ